MRGLYRAAGYVIEVSTHGWFQVLSPRLADHDLPEAFCGGNVRELGHGIHYMGDELSESTDGEIERAVAENVDGTMANKPDKHLSTLDDDLNVDIRDPVIGKAAKAWLRSHLDELRDIEAKAMT